MTEQTEQKRKRGRPRKTTVIENENILTDDIAPETLRMEQTTPVADSGVKQPKLTMSDVQNSLKGLYADILGAGGFTKNITDFNLNNPFLQNSRLKLIDAYPATYKPEEIAEALKSPQDHEEMLRQASAGLSASQYLYYKILREAQDVPLYKHYILPPVLDESDYQSKKFIDEEEFVDKWLKVFDPQRTLKRVAMDVKRQGKATYIFRQCIEERKGKKEPAYVIWQKLPQQFVKLTAIGQYGYIASFNMLIFLQPAFSPLQYPDYIQKIWNALQSDGAVRYNKKEDKYEPDLDKLRSFSFKYNGQDIKGNLESSMISRVAAETSYMYWVQLPADLCFTFESDMSNSWAAPDTMGMFSALQELADYSTLAGLVASTPLTAVLTGQAEIIDNSQAGQDQTEVSPHTVDAFTTLFNSMVSGNIQAFFAPFKDMKLQSLPNIPNSSDIKTKAVQNFISVAGEGGLIASSDKPSLAQIKGAQLMAESQYDSVTRQFETILNMTLRRWTDCMYDWKINLWGSVFTYENQIKIMKEQVAGGATYLLPRLASAYNMTMRDVRGVSTYIDAFKIYDRFKTLGWAQTITRASVATDKSGEEATSDGAGRKLIEDTDIESDATAQSRETGANTTEMKQDYAANGMCILCGGPTEEGHALCEDCEETYGIDSEV